MSNGGEDDIDEMVRYIRIHAQGNRRALKARILGEHFGIHERQVRKLVAFARARHIPVGSCSSGYFWCVTESDVLIAYAHLTSLFTPLRQAYEGFKVGAEAEFGEKVLQEKLF